MQPYKIGCLFSSRALLLRAIPTTLWVPDTQPLRCLSDCDFSLKQTMRWPLVPHQQPYPEYERCGGRFRGRSHGRSSCLVAGLIDRRLISLITLTIQRNVQELTAG
eukprot:12900577-Heterocapsa_arctica.AAC.1